MGAINSDVVIVGGGAMGSAAAWQLARRGVDVTLLERFAPGHTNGASHGASRIFRVSYPDPVYVGLAREAQQYWGELEDLTGADLLTITGGVEHGNHPFFEEYAEGLAAAGVKSEWLSSKEATERWPGIRFAGRALFHPESGRLHADNAVTALQLSAEKHGAVVRHEVAVDAITVRGDDSVEITAGEDSYLARRVIVSAGAWTTKLAAHLAPLPELVVTQEQPAHFAALIPEAQWPSFGQLFDPDSDDGRRFYGGIYALATPGAGIKVGFHGVGPVVDPDLRNFQPEPDQLRTLQDYVRTWVPGADADALIPISCTYTTSPDSNFVLDRIGPVVIGAGFSGHGFKFVPAIGRVLADLALTGERPDARFAFQRSESGFGFPRK
jgi:sarcosine oxidase